ncbi:MAG TPA: NUDIX hydrolase [Chitinophagaceae bacterium]|nr:NUDIX hydrolase [Chitinophagaceae bacterium]
MKWKTISSSYISNHIYFTARKDVCERADGTIIDPYFVVELPTSATALAITEEGKVVLVKQYRHPVDEVILETPGGFIDPGEDFATGMLRELGEETGYTFSHIEHVGRVAANPGLLNNYTELFLATGGKKTGAQALDHNEEIEIVLVSMEELMVLLEQQQIKQALHTSCIFFALMKMGQLSITVGQQR